MERFNLKKLQHGSWNSIKLKSEIALQLWKTWMIMWISIGVGKVLEHKNIIHRESKLL